LPIVSKQAGGYGAARLIAASPADGRGGIDHLCSGGRKINFVDCGDINAKRPGADLKKQDAGNGDLKIKLCVCAQVARAGDDVGLCQGQ